MILRFTPAVGLFVLLVIPGCGECTAIANCEVPPRVQATGVIVNDQNRQPVEGARVRFTYRGGAGVGPVTEPRELEGITDSLGRYRLEAVGEKAGRIVGTLSFSPPSDRFQSARPIEGVSLEISALRRDLLLDTLVLVVDARPMIRAVGRVVDHRSGEPIAGVTVLYRIASGPRPLEGGDSLVSVSDAEGRYELEAMMNVFGSTVGSLSFLLPPPSPTRLFEPVVFNTSGRIDWEEQVDPVDMVHPGYLRATGRVVSAQSGQPLVGIAVRFEPRAGPSLEPAVPEGITDAEGRFTLTAHGGESGPVVGALVVEAPAPFGQVRFPEVEIPAGTDPDALFGLGDLELSPGGIGGGP